MIKRKRYTNDSKEAVMKICLQQVDEGEEEILIRYRQMTPRLQQIVEYLQREQVAVIGRRNGMSYQLLPEEIYYFERVDERIFAYTEKAEYQVMLTLAEAEEALQEYGFFRCNKSFVLNSDHIISVRSEMGNRINAILDNQEHVIISRRYAKDFREMLKRGISHE